jgi:MoxR-like ATPase
MFDLKSIRNSTDNSPQNYRLEDEGLKMAIQMAIWLEKPLLLTGAPGTGKTQLAHKVAYDLSLSGDETNCANFIDKPFIFNTKTTSTCTDLFYSYDAIRHFQKKYSDQIGNTQDETTAHSYIKLNALGRAIVQSHGGEGVKGNEELKDLQKLLDFDKIIIPELKSSVVLIDEIDKAPRDFPNDLLNEIDNMEFSINELMNLHVKKNENNRARILVIMTSNFEKALPDAFLRRCLFYHIPSPNQKELIEIVNLRMGGQKNVSQNIETIVTEFMTIRDSLKDKKPSTAELLEWVKVLAELSLLNGILDFKTLNEDQKNKIKKSYSALAKSKDDLEILTRK